ncbi:MAG: amidohydrolase family protein, partial [Armatimonadota bacterium]
MSSEERPIAIMGGDVMRPNGLARRAGVVTRGGRVAAILAPDEAPPPGADIIDAEGRTVLPGFIDIHCHGGGGASFDSASPEEIDTILATHAREGTTAMVAALPALPPDQRHAALRTLREYMRRQAAGPELLGAYMEGPYFSAAERGAQPEGLIGPPTPDDYRPTLEQFGDIIKVWSLAPELPGAMEFIRELTARGIVPALGHSNAGHEDVLAAIDAGAKLVTHVYC